MMYTDRIAASQKIDTDSRVVEKNDWNSKSVSYCKTSMIAQTRIIRHGPSFHEGSGQSIAENAEPDDDLRKIKFEKNFQSTRA